jgi:hypothetical protein
MAIDDILRLQATTFAMAMRKNVNGPGKNEAYSRCRYLVSFCRLLLDRVDDRKCLPGAMAARISRFPLGLPDFRI